MNRLLTTFVVGLAGIQGVTQAADSRPKLVVGIMVDQLRTDYIEDLKEMLAPGGFRRLMENGAYLKDVDFKIPGLDAAAASAIIQTGAYPRQNGISGAEIYDPSSKSLKPVFNDEAYIGNFTNETYSPVALKVTTLSDEIALEGGERTRIHSIAPDAAQAIILAGHSANSSFWVNDETGKWATSTYYPNPPAALQNKNYNSPLVSRIDTMRWTPLKKDVSYPYVSSQEIREGFRYNFPRSDKDVFSLYKSSPFVNRDITDAAEEYITSLNLGKGYEATDVLNLAYTLAPYPNIEGTGYRYELEDAYLRLDKDLERLFKTLDRHVGKENVLVYLVSTGNFSEPDIDLSTHRLPGGSFSVKRALSLLKSFLAAKYGNGVYVEQYANGQIFLSRKEIEEKNLDLNKITEEARDFLLKMSGIADAYTLGELLGAGSSQFDNIRLGIDPKTSGDIFIEYNPGWTVTDDSVFPAKTEQHKTMIYAAPAFIMGSGISPQIVEETVDAVAITPTLANRLRIRSPNSTIAKPLKLD